MIRLDLVFSIWIFVWFVLFFIGLLKYNPTFVILLGIAVASISTYLGVYYFDVDRYNVTKFIIINIITKGFPISLLWYYHQLSIKYRDIIFTLGLFLVYNIYLLINGTTILRVYNDMMKAYQNKNENDDKRTFLSKMYDYVYDNLF